MSNIKRDYIKETKELNNIPLSTVGNWLGLSLPERGKTNCPFHDDKNPSFNIDFKRNRWVCYPCDLRGGAIDLVKEYLNHDFITAKQWLLERVRNSPIENSIRRLPAGLPIKKHGTNYNLTPDIELYEELIANSPLQASGINYLTQRAISKPTLEKLRIGQVFRPKEITTTLINKFGFERVNKSGVLTKYSTKSNPSFIFSQGRLLFPLIKKGVIISFQARYCGDPPDNQPKYMNLNGQPHYVYNMDALTSSDSKISICEGPIDTLSAIELGINAVGILGTSADLPIELIRKMRRKQVNILLDWDDSGEKKAKKLEHIFKGYGVVSTRKNRPSLTANDLNEFLVEERKRV